MSSEKQLKVFTLKYDEHTNSISPGVAYINPADTLREMYKIIGCSCVTCTAIEINGKKYDVWSDDEALLKSNPVPNLCIDDDIVIFGNLLIAKSNEEGKMVGLDKGEPQLLYAFAQISARIFVRIHSYCETVFSDFMEVP